MNETILLAAALQHWERYSAHALAAREVAAALAGSTSKPLHVLSVYDHPHTTTVTGLAPEVAARFHEEQRQRTDNLMAHKLDAYIAPLITQGVKVSRLLRVGTPREVIPQVAREIQADLLIIGTHSKRGLFDIALGGTAQQVTKSAPCTVLLVSPKK